MQQPEQPPSPEGLRKRRLTTEDYFALIEESDRGDEPAVPRFTPPNFPAQRRQGDLLVMPPNVTTLGDEMSVFRVERVLGSGVYGDALLATVQAGTASGELVVLKEFRGNRLREGVPLYPNEDKFLTTVQSEFSISVLLAHRSSNRVRLRNYVVLARGIFSIHISLELQIVYIIFPYMEHSMTLSTYVRERLVPLWAAGLTARYVEKALNIGHTLLQALAELHTLGVFHVDLKRDNILVVDDGITMPYAVLIDLGRACAMPDPVYSSRSMRSTRAQICPWPYHVNDMYQDPLASRLPQPRDTFDLTRHFIYFEMFSAAVALFELFNQGVGPPRRPATPPRAGSAGYTGPPSVELSPIEETPPAPMRAVRGLVGLVSRMRGLWVQRMTSAEAVMHMERIREFHAVGGPPRTAVSQSGEE